MDELIIGYFDGACEPHNPGGAMGFGALIILGGEILYTESGMLPAAKTNSNNVAEYRALIMLLERLMAMEMADQQIEIRGDSNLVIKQMSGDWKIKTNGGGLYVPMAQKARALAAKFKHLRFKWIPREQNCQADELSKLRLIDANIIRANV
jgi:ribonuclease HI